MVKQVAHPVQTTLMNCQGVDAVSSTVALTFGLPLYYLFIS